MYGQSQENNIMFALDKSLTQRKINGKLLPVDISTSTTGQIVNCIEDQKISY